MTIKAPEILFSLQTEDFMGCSHYCILSSECEYHWLPILCDASFCSGSCWSVKQDLTSPSSYILASMSHLIKGGISAPWPKPIKSANNEREIALDGDILACTRSVSPSLLLSVCVFKAEKLQRNFGWRKQILAVSRLCRRKFLSV